jgi:hypothetical protein
MNSEQPLDFANGQVKRLGMAESFTPELQSAIRRGDALIQHPFRMDYNKDVVNVMQHWKKSNTSENHFLNKYDIELLKAGKEQAIKQTIYLGNRPGQENGTKIPNINYTLKEAYNLLSGRPVFKDLVSREGDTYKAWVQLDLTQQFPSGNYKTKVYNENYGFKLEDVLRRYPILELLRELFKTRLFESLERGNLQKMHLIGNDKKQEPVLASPSIANGSLNLYDMDGKRIPLETQVQKNWITKEFAQEQKERFAQKNKPQKQKEQVQQVQKRQSKGRSLKKGSS